MHQRPYVKGGFNWTMPPPKGQGAKGYSGSPCCDRLSNPLFFLILILSAFLAISATVLTISEYWALEMQPGGAFGCLPCGTLGELAQGKSDGIPKGWEFLKERSVVLVIDKLSLAEPARLLVLLAELLVKAEANVSCVTTGKATPGKQQRLEAQLAELKVKVLRADRAKTSKALVGADLVVLGSILAGPLLDDVPKERLPAVLRKTAWWIHEQGSHYMTKPLLRYLPGVAVVVVDSQAAGEALKQGVKSALSMELPPTHVVPLGISREASQAADTPVAQDLLRRYVRDALDLRPDAIVVSLICGSTGADLFLHAFKLAVDTCQARKPDVIPTLQALLIGSDWQSQAKLEADLRQYVEANGLLPAVRFVNQTYDAVPYLAASDVVVVNAQEKGESSMRTVLNAMAFRLPILASAAGENLEIVTNKTNGFLHDVGKEGVGQLATNIADLALDPKLANDLTKVGYERVRDRYLESQFTERLGQTLRMVVESKGQEDASNKGKRKKRVKLVVEVVR